MTIRNIKYHLHPIPCLIVFFFIITGGKAFSQGYDSTVTDSVNILEQDDTEARESDDSLKKPAYNYYYNRAEWTKDSLLFRQVPDSVIKSFQSQDDFWYANKDFEKKKENDNSGGRNIWDWLASQRWYKAVAWIIIIGGFITVLIWFLASSNVRIFRRRSMIPAQSGEGEMTENIFEIDYQKEIDRAMNEGNYRVAVRLLFLRLLKNLSEQNVIQYKQGRTNFDYLAQVSNKGYYEDFFRLTRNYEYSWYGEFPVGREIFDTIKNDFENFEKRVK